ncbi:MAG: hypothetical protein JSS79_10300 [Bacteroidetes bacterium]|nr:hypothetical protein [Bacteroidota bacterium]
MTKRILIDFLLLFLLFFVSTSIAYLLETLVSDEVWAAGAEEFMTQAQIEKALAKRSDISWLLIIQSLKFVWLFIKALVTTLVILMGVYLSNKNIVNGAEIFRSVIIGEFAHFIPGMAMVIWFTFVKTDFSVHDISAFPIYFPTDLLLRNLESPFFEVLRPFRIFNLSEVMYCLVISLSLKSGEFSFWKSTKVVSLSYFVLLLVVSIFRSFFIAMRL